MKVILIEDDVKTVESIKLCFEVYQPGIKLTSMDRGLDALELLKNEKFDIAIVDLGLPDIDGMNVIQQLRSFSDMPVVVLSARHTPEVINQALKLGAKDYITKPFKFNKLLSTVKGS